MVDEHAGQLLADGLVDQHSGNRAVDTARQAADHASTAHLRADVGDLRVLEARHRPVAGAAGHVAHEIGEQLAAVGRVHDLRVEHQAVALRLFVGGDGKRRAFRTRDDLETRRQSLDAIAMAHPHLMLFADRPEPVEQLRRSGDLDERAAEFALVRSDHLAAQLLVQSLLPVADAEQRNAAVEQHLRSAGAVLGRDRRGPSGEDHAFRLQPLERLFGGVERSNLAINASLAHAPGDQLRDLAAEVDDEDGLGGLDRHGGRIESIAAGVNLGHPLLAHHLIRCYFVSVPNAWDGGNP